MGNFVFILLIIALIMVIVGGTMVVLTIKFVNRKEHPVLSIVFSVLQCPCICVPINITMGFTVAIIALLFTFVYGVVMIILSLRNMKKK